MIESQFNRKNLQATILLALVGLAPLCFSSFRRLDILIGVGVFLGSTVVFLLGYGAWLKRITVLSDGLEVKSVLLPFWKRFYRFAEFDYSELCHTRQGEVLRLIKDGRRVVSVSSFLYQNYECIWQSIAVKGKEQFSVRDTAEVVSEYKLSRIYIAGGFFGLLTFLMALMPLGQYWEGKDVTWGLILFSLLGALFFGTLFLGVLFPCQRITVWQGQIDVRRLLWPFRVKHYQLADFDGCYYVTAKHDYFGFKEDEMRWLVKNGKVVIDMQEDVYRNFEALKNATQTNFLGQLELTTIQIMKYSLGKKIQL